MLRKKEFLQISVNSKFSTKIFDENFIQRWRSKICSGRSRSRNGSNLNFFFHFENPKIQNFHNFFFLFQSKLRSPARNKLENVSIENFGQICFFGSSIFQFSIEIVGFNSNSKKYEQKNQLYSNVFRPFKIKT